MDANLLVLSEEEEPILNGCVHGILVEFNLGSELFSSEERMDKTDGRYPLGIYD